jgi:hypothetical protein
MSLASEQVRKQVDRVIHSRTFETSEAHRHLLQYLADQALSGDGDLLKEYTIGLEAFGKPSDYDPRHDSIVRFQAGRLRHKLAEYYRSEATPEEIRISFPKGGFKLVFEESNTKANGAAKPWNLSGLHWALAGTLVLALAWTAIATWRMVRAERAAAIATQSWTPELQALWEPFLNNPRPILVCLGAPLFVRFPEYGFFRDPKTNDFGSIDNSERITALRRALRAQEFTPSYAFTGTGEATAGILIGRLLATTKPDFMITRSNLLNWQQIADHDVVFIGPPKFNQQLEATILGSDLAIEPGGIRNRKPRPGEPAFLADRFLPGKVQEGDTHALISRIPHPSGKRELLVLAGNASADTLAAAEWVTDASHARDLVHRLGGRGAKLPRHFQVVIKVSFKQGVPVSSAYAFHHVL